MPILYLHGVANRPGPGHDAAVAAIGAFAARYVAPAISADPAGVEFIPVGWGDLGARLAWDGASRPRSQLLGMGGAGTAPPLPQRLQALNEHLTGLEAVPTGPPAGSAPISGGLISGSSPPVRAGGSDEVRLRDVGADALADLLAAALQAIFSPEDPRLGAAVLAADDVAHDPQVRADLAAAADLSAELACLQSAFDTRFAEVLLEQGGLVGMGGGGWGRRLRDRIGEVAGRGLSAPAWAASRVLLEARKPLNTLASAFLGDILIYVQNRGTAEAPGPIPKRLLDSLARAVTSSAARDGEPVVLLTHSMGGQIAYDVLTAFLPASQRAGTPGLAGARVDFWAAAASQVPFFEELKLFLASDPQFGAAAGRRAPRPDRAILGVWWNVWDPNDVLSFTARPVFDGVVDEEYDGGMSLAGAHGAYLTRPSFYRRLGERLAEAAGRDWERT